MAGGEEFRPARHFAPRSGWINDPNGLIYADGVWHLFYQHNPVAIVHGPMHWGHAVSRDLVNWDERPIALHPDAGGECFSGSAVAAGEGSVSAELAGNVLLFYTAHKKHPDGTDDQVQALALADPGLTRFEKFAGNPILANPGHGAFRDPKVIWHAPTGHWVMVMTHGQEIGFYASPDAVNWSLASTFGATAGRHSDGPWECPDLFPLALGGEELWVLVVGIGRGGLGGGSGTQYFVGRFDGTRFENLNPTELWLDHGADCYATQSWSGPTPVHTAISWMSNWSYAQKTPNAGFRGAMTLPRELSLVATAGGPRLSQRVPQAVRASFPSLTATAGSNPVPGPVYRVEIAANGPLDICLFGESEPHFVLEAGALRYLRRDIGLAGFARDLSLPLSGSLEIFVDHGAVELVSTDGLVSISSLNFPADVAGPLTLRRR